MELLAQRLRTPFAEVDLLFRHTEGHLVLVEVKTAQLQDFQPFRVGQKQKQRLVRAMLFLAERWQLPVEIHWAFVTKDGDVTVFEGVCD